MTPYSGLLFFYLMGLLLLPAIVLGLLEKPLKHYGLLFTLVMLAFTFSGNGQLIPLTIFYLWQTGLCILCLRLKGKGCRAMRGAALLALLPLMAVSGGDIKSAQKDLGDKTTHMVLSTYARSLDKQHVAMNREVCRIFLWRRCT